MARWGGTYWSDNDNNKYGSTSSQWSDRGWQNWNSPQKDADPWASGDDPWGGMTTRKRDYDGWNAGPPPAQAAGGGSAPGNSNGQAPADPAACIRGIFMDEQQNLSQLVVEGGGVVTAQSLDDSWKPETGRFTGNEIKIFGLTGYIYDGVIRWTNGTVWRKQSDGAAAQATAGATPAAGAPGEPPNGTAGAAPAPSAAAPAPSAGASALAWEASPPPGFNAGNAAPAVGGLAPSVAAFFQGRPPEQNGLGEKDQLRWKVFIGHQEQNRTRGVLPARSQAEADRDEKRLNDQRKEVGAGIDFGLYDDVPCRIDGPNADVIPCFKTFEDMFCELHEYLPQQLIDNIRKCGYSQPTPVQKYAIPPAVIGRDVMCCAQTGSGKTAAFLIPSLSSMMKYHRGVCEMQEPFKGPCKPNTLILSPTRELCLQIYDEALKFTRGTPFRCVRVYGQEQVNIQLAEIARGADLCVATPGRLWDFVSSGVMEVKEVCQLILDEADRMLEMKMEEYIRDVVEKHGMPCKENRQTMMFSATFPESTQKMALDYLYDHIWVGVGSLGGAACTVQQEFIQVAPEAKHQKLRDLLCEWLEAKQAGEKWLVFTNSKLQAKGLDEQLWKQSIDTGALHGDLTQCEREENLRKFRVGEIDVMVATDVASRGLDITGVSTVVNYDLPFSTEVYVQRIGRTGRIGHRGRAITFIAVEKNGVFRDRLEVLQDLPRIIREGNNQNEVPDWFTEGLARQTQAGGVPGTWSQWNGNTGIAAQVRRASEAAPQGNAAPAPAGDAWANWDEVKAVDGSSTNKIDAAKAAGPTRYQ